jgi:hypothetical protein
MDDRYGRETWFDAAFAIEEVRNLKKWARADAGIPTPTDASSCRKAPRPGRGEPTPGGSIVLYQLHHFHLQSGEDWTQDHEDNDFPLGDYTSLAALKSKIDERSDQFGFRDWPGGFRTFVVTLDEVWWKEGFISIHDPAFLDPPDDTTP